jgi:hypothetical protein
MTAERRAVPGWEGMYEISSDGEVFSLPRKHSKGCKLKLRYRPANSPQVVLKDGRKGRIQALNIARTVLTVFGGPPEHESLLALHKDGDRANNRLGNLKWGSYAEMQEIRRQLALEVA